jgi:hypothetical protein
MSPYPPPRVTNTDALIALAVVVGFAAMLVVAIVVG